MAARDPGTRSSAPLGAESGRVAKAPPRPELRSDCNSQRLPATGKAKEDERVVIGGALRALVIGTRSLRSEEVVDLAAPCDPGKAKWRGVCLT